MCTHVMKKTRNTCNRPYLTPNTDNTLSVEVKKNEANTKYNNFRYKIQHKCLPTKDAAMHLCWNHTDETVAPKQILSKLRRDHNLAAKWYAKQVLYQDQKCPLCGEKETQGHTLSQDCKHVQNKNPVLAEVFKTIIERNGGSNQELIGLLL